LSASAFQRRFEKVPVRTRLVLNASITIGLALLVAFTVVVSSGNIERVESSKRFADRVIRDASDLNSLGYAYLLLKNERPKVQWNLKHAALGKILAAYRAGSHEEQALLTKLRFNHEQMKLLFDAATARVEKVQIAPETDRSAYDELNEGLTAQLMARAETMVNDASLLVRDAGRHTDATRRMFLILILSSALILIAWAAVGAVVFGKSLGDSIRALEQGTRRIAAGDLTYRLDVVGDNEISRLSAAFNDMTTRLGDSYATLEERVEGRTADLAERTAELEAANQALGESELRWATTLASIGDAVIATDLAGRVTFMNAVAEMLTGWTLHEASMKPAAAVFNIVNEHTRAQVEGPVAQVLEKGVIVGLANHTILIRQDGTEVPIDDSGAPIRYRDGTTMGVVLVFRDITSRKQTEKTLKESRERLDLAVESASMGVWHWDLVEGRRSFDHQACSLLGIEPATFTGRSDEFFSAVHPDDREMLRAALSRTIEQGVPYEPEYRAVWPDGSVHYIAARGRLVRRDASGDPEGINGVIWDISDRKRTDEALRKAHDELEIRIEERTAELRQAYDRLMDEIKEREKAEAQLRQAQKMEALGTLSGGIAHDFNNILAAIIGFSEIAADRIPAESGVQRPLKRIHEAGLRGRDLVKQMLTFSRKTEQEKKPLIVADIVKESIKLLRASLPATISINLNMKNESAMIMGDQVQIQQVLMNLCTNAAYAMQEKSGTLDIELSDHCVSPSTGTDGMKPGPYVRLVVRDTGAGIPADIMDKIFDPFFTTKKQGEGTGLGLSVVHGIVKQHDGYIMAESEPNRGSTFTACFPKITGELEAGVAGDDTLPTGFERILFVDDEEALVEMGETILAELGYQVTSRLSSREALALFKLDPSRFDLVITDQTMPELTGVNLAKEILAVGPDMPIIMCTGFSNLVDADTAKTVGIRAFAMKPLTKREIAKTIRQVLGK
jgi:PAS domain S-box-containing protein